VTRHSTVAGRRGRLLVVEDNAEEYQVTREDIERLATGRARGRVAEWGLEAVSRVPVPGARGRSMPRMDG